MSRRQPGLPPVLLSLVFLTAAPTAAAQAEEPPDGDTHGWHLVRPGDTLRDVTEHYLGDPELWPENWKLNPWIRDPDVILPGQRLRVIVDGQADLVARRRQRPLPRDIEIVVGDATAAGTAAAGAPAAGARRRGGARVRQPAVPLERGRRGGGLHAGGVPGRRLRRAGGAGAGAGG